MEGLPYDFGNEEDDEALDKKKAEKRPTISRELLTAVSKDQKFEKATEKSPETVEEIDPSNDQEIADNAPELDAEAPLEHLSNIETEVIAQAMASDRLAEIEVSEEVSSESLAAASFLENVEATGDIDQAYSETMQELGEAALNSSSQDIEVETETAPPIDPRVLIEAAKSEIGPSSPTSTASVNGIESVSYPKSSPKTEKSPKSHKVETKSTDIFGSIIDYVTGRRYGRLSDKNQHEIVERKLSEEVVQLQKELSSHELYVRQIAKNRKYDKQDRPKAPKPELKKSKEIAGLSAHTMDIQELLQVASEIPSGESTLKTVYEDHLIGEKGLRRVVAEYLRGENHQKALSRELVEREKDFERDPYLRDQASTIPVVPQTVNLDRLLKKTGIDFNEPQPMMTRSKVKGSSLPGLIEQLNKPSKKPRRIFDIALISTLLLMATVIILLIIYR